MMPRAWILWRNQEGSPRRRRLRKKEILEKLNEICKQEEIYWKQRSRLQWLKEGDEKKNYHAVANGRKNPNLIPRMRMDGTTIESPHDIGIVFAGHFKLQFGCRRPARLRVDLRKIFAHKVSIALADLERPFMIDEVKWAVFDLGGDKAPGLDGFPIHFFK